MVHKLRQRMYPKHVPFGDVPLVEFMHLVFTRMPGGVTVGDSGHYCCVPCLSNAIISLGLLTAFYAHFAISSHVHLETGKNLDLVDLGAGAGGRYKPRS